MNIHKKLGPFPVWAWGVAIGGGLMLGLYLRHRAKAAAQGASPNQTIADYLAGAGGGGIADPNAGLDSNGVLSGLLNQNQQVLDYLLALAGGGGGVPAIPDPPTYEPQPVAQPSSVASSGGSGASPNPNPAAPAPTDSTFSSGTPVDVTSAGSYLGTITAPYFDPSRPASELYASVGLAPSSPFTLLPGGSSTGPNAQLGNAAQPVYDLSSGAPVQVGTTADMPRVPVGQVYAT